MANQLVMVIARPINQYVSCKLPPYSFQRTLSPPGYNDYMDAYFQSSREDMALEVTKQLSSVSVCRTQVFAGFSGRGNSINNCTFLFTFFLHKVI